LRCSNSARRDDLDLAGFAHKSAIVIIACAAAIVIAIIGGVVLSGLQEPVDEAFASPTAVRLGV
jgi:hypothetical protein